MVEHCNEVTREVAREVCRRYVRNPVEGNGNVCRYSGSEILSYLLISELGEPGDTHFLQEVRREHEHICVSCE
jgi:hypothetical protein